MAFRLTRPRHHDALAERGATSAGCSGPAVAANHENDVSCLLLRFDVLRGLDHLLQRVAPIDDRPVLPRLDELLEEEDVLLRCPLDPEHHFLVSDPRGPQYQE